jgi:hypothetical protein
MQQTQHDTEVNANRAAGAAAGESRRRRASRAATADLINAATTMPTAAMRPYAHAGRVARGARTRCTHLHPRRTASMPRSRDALFASAWLVASRIVPQGGGRPMTAGAFVQRSYRTRRNLLLSHPVHAAEEGFSTKGSSPH